MNEGTGETGSRSVGTGSLCSFVSTPFPECYCRQLTGRNIVKVVSFCAADFRACPVYRAAEAAARERAGAD
jgi:hypothetical protein